MRIPTRTCPQRGAAAGRARSSQSRGLSPRTSVLRAGPYFPTWVAAASGEQLGAWGLHGAPGGVWVAGRSPDGPESLGGLQVGLESGIWHMVWLCCAMTEKGIPIESWQTLLE